LRSALTLALLLALAAPAQAADLTGRADRVIDGDTFVLQGVKIRLWGIQAPERGEGGYKAATEGLRSILADRDVTCEKRSTDPYKRTVARCFVAGQDVAAQLVSRRLAVDWPRYSGGFYASVRQVRP
jgi:endonuclease YncB( thermonuclease family)